MGPHQSGATGLYLALGVPGVISISRIQERPVNGVEQLCGADGLACRIKLTFLAHMAKLFLKSAAVAIL